VPPPSKQRTNDAQTKLTRVINQRFISLSTAMFRVELVSTLMLPFFALMTLSAADEYDVYSTEQGHEIGWVKVLSCDENGSTKSWAADLDAILSRLDSAVTLQFLPRDSTPSDFDFTNDTSDEFAVMISLCANPMIAVNHGLTPSWTYNLDTMAVSGQTDLNNWLGSSAAKARLRNTCRGDGASAFESVLYHACGNTEGIHLTSSQCTWDWQDNIAGVEGMSAWLGFTEGQCEVVDGEPTLVTVCDTAQCEDPFVCDADADLFETVSEAQYPCKRDCDLFAIDEYLDQCSAVFPAAIETVSASIDGVGENVLQITNVDIPAVSARVQLNEDAVTAINDELSSVNSRIEALSDVDAATDARIDAVTSLAENNAETIDSLEQRIAFLESRIEGFEASAAHKAAAGKSDDGQLDVGAGAELFGSTAQLTFKDELIGALVATNLILMAGLVCLRTKRCNAKHKYAAVGIDSESEKL